MPQPNTYQRAADTIADLMASADTPAPALDALYAMFCDLCNLFNQDAGAGDAEAARRLLPSLFWQYEREVRI